MKIKPVKTDPLRVPPTIENRYAQAVTAKMEKFYAEVDRAMLQLFKDPDYAMDGDSPSLSSQARIKLNALLRKWQPIFNDLAKSATDQMLDRITKATQTSLTGSLKEASKFMTLDSAKMTERTREILTASGNEAAALIKRIPAQYIPEVQGAVSRSIISGNGLKDLVPFLKDKYNGDIKHARRVAMDQTRKAYNGLATGRMQAMGIKKFEWVHTGGTTHPRKQHLKWSGQIFNIDEPPYNPESGENELPGQPPYCRCVMKPIIEFDEDDE